MSQLRSNFLLDSLLKSADQIDSKNALVLPNNFQMEFLILDNCLLCSALLYYSLLYVVQGDISMKNCHKCGFAWVDT